MRIITVTFGISNEGTPLEDGAYKILVQGSGKDASSCTVQLPVWVIKPSEIPGIVSKFNSADSSNLIGYINEVKNALKLDVKAVESAERKAAFISIRQNDFSDSFATLEDISNSWKISEIIECLSISSPDKVLLQELIEKNSAIIGIDTENEDYKYTSQIYKNMVYGDNAKDTDSIEKVRNLFNSSVAIAVVNGASSSDISQKLDKYYKILGIDEDIYEKYLQCSEKQTKQKIQRMLLDKNFKTADKIRETFEEAVKKYITDKDSSSSSASSSGGGGGSRGGAATSGMGAAVNSAVTDIEETQNTVASFKDCPQNHWAYKYVEELRSDNIISGYADGNFYPDNKVKREEFIKMIVVLSGITSQDVSCDFDDVSAFAWYRPFVASAFDAGIVKGVDDRNFGVGSDISRQDVAVIICRLLDKLGTDINAKSDKTFADEQDISDYASESVDTLSALSVLNGYEDGTFRPKASLTRAEASKIICLVKALIK